MLEPRMPIKICSNSFPFPISQSTTGWEYFLPFWSPGIVSNCKTLSLTWPSLPWSRLMEMSRRVTAIERPKWGQDSHVICFWCCSKPSMVCCPTTKIERIHMDQELDIGKNDVPLEHVVLQKLPNYNGSIFLFIVVIVNFWPMRIVI